MVWPCQEKKCSLISQQLVFIESIFRWFWFCSNLLDNSYEVQLYSSQLQLRAMTGTRFVQIEQHWNDSYIYTAKKLHARGKQYQKKKKKLFTPTRGRLPAKKLRLSELTLDRYTLSPLLDHGTR